MQKYEVCSDKPAGPQTAELDLAIYGRLSQRERHGAARSASGKLWPPSEMSPADWPKTPSPEVGLNICLAMEVMDLEEIGLGRRASGTALATGRPELGRARATPATLNPSLLRPPSTQH